MSSFVTFARLGEALSATHSRKRMAQLIADYLRGLAPEEISTAARLIIGRVFPESDDRVLNVSGSAVDRVLRQVITLSEGERRAALAGAVDFGEAVQGMFEHGHRLGPQGSPLTLMDVYRACEEIAATTGPGSRAVKDALLRALLERASPVEAKYIVKVVVKEMRHGVSEGILMDGIALAAGVPASEIRRANMLVGDVGRVAEIALRDGTDGLARLSAGVGRPIKPMLAQTADDIPSAFEMLGGELALEYKLDGARLQIHVAGDRVWLFSRHLSDVTASLPEIVDWVRRGFAGHQVIAEGEVIAVDHRGRVLPFQDLMQRIGRVHEIDRAREEVPLQLHLFDLLYLDGKSLLDRPNTERWAALERVHGPLALVRRIVPQSIAEGEAFLQQARAAGQEGLMAKALDSPYTPGVRGRHWLKIKPAVTLDLVIVAADWGYGRRHGWLSNYHLAARDENTGEFLEVGKTFKGLTDAEFQQMTKRLLSLETGRGRYTVYVRPEVVVEVAFNNIQRSPQYKSGVALRFARITRFRPDKRPEEADTIQTMRKMLG
ncbi:MAG: ATP-dependent DNA ligase [Chloroflexi bacterium]|nr:ATP-dependent DNA ligase [Chloroflexota bacterium]